MPRHASRRPSQIVRSHAKINLTLRILDRRPDGYHELRTVFQTVALHDTVTVTRRPGPFDVACTQPGVPCDERNLAWQAAVALWRAAGRPGAPVGAGVRIVKRIPMAAGLGGGSSNAAAALRGLAGAWGLAMTRAELAAVGASVGADVPFFLWGGTALGLGRGDVIYPLADLSPAWVVLVQPAFGVATAEAYRWYDDWTGAGRPAPSVALPAGWPFPASESGNDLEPPVAARHPELRAIRAVLAGGRASYAAMSGSGSTVFGLFERREAAARAARRCAREGWQAVATRTQGRLRWPG